MKIHALIHASFETTGVISEWATKRKHTLDKTHSYKGETLPTVDDFDFLIVMGGPQSCVELEKYPYLEKEVDLISQAIEHDKFILGICLGAQLIGEALGAKSALSPEKEIGIYPIQLTEDGKSDSVFQHFPEEFNVAHWHHDMPGIPEGGKLLAKSPGCPQQAFNYGNKIYGLQFHMEFNQECITKLAENALEDLTASLYTQSKDEFLKQNLDSINQRLFLFLDKFTELERGE